MISTLLFPLNWLLSLLASTLRLGAGGPGKLEPVSKTSLVLYEFEGCPYCRITREQVSETGLTVHIKPCPKGGKRFRPEVLEKGGKTQFPYLIDYNAENSNGEIGMYESATISRYLQRRVKGSLRPLVHWAGPINQLLSQFAVMARFMSGTIARTSVAPDQPLRLYASERSPGGRLVKETLCSRELEYLWASRPPNNQATPYLIDANSGAERIGTLPILKYLSNTYPRTH